MLANAAAYQSWEPSVLHNPWVGNDGAGAACCSSDWLLNCYLQLNRLADDPALFRKSAQLGHRVPKRPRASAVILTMALGPWWRLSAHQCCRGSLPTLAGLVPTAAPIRDNGFIGWFLMWPSSLHCLQLFHWCRNIPKCSSSASALNFLT